MAHREVCPGPRRADWQDTGRIRMVGTCVKAGPGLYSLARDLYGGRVKEQRDNDRFRRINAAFLAGDLPALLDAVDEPGVVPNGPMPPAIGPASRISTWCPIRARCQAADNPDGPAPTIRIFLPLGSASISGTQPSCRARSPRKRSTAWMLTASSTWRRLQLDSHG